MSIGNLKTYGNKGNNFPFQLAVLKGLELSKCAHLTEVVITAPNAADLETNIRDLLAAASNKYLVSKSVVFDSATPEFVAFLTIATI